MLHWTSVDLLQIAWLPPTASHPFYFLLVTWVALMRLPQTLPSVSYSGGIGFLSSHLSENQCPKPVVIVLSLSGGPANAALLQVCNTNPLISNPSFHESKSVSLSSTLYLYFVCLCSFCKLCLGLTFSPACSWLHESQGQSRQQAHCGRHLFAMVPFIGRRRELQTVLLWATL